MSTLLTLPLTQARQQALLNLSRWERRHHETKSLVAANPVQRGTLAEQRELERQNARKLERYAHMVQQCQEQLAYANQWAWADQAEEQRASWPQPGRVQRLLIQAVEYLVARAQRRAVPVLA